MPLVSRYFVFERPLSAEEVFEILPDAAKKACSEWKPSAGNYIPGDDITGRVSRGQKVGLEVRVKYGPKDPAVCCFYGMEIHENPAWPGERPSETDRVIVERYAEAFASGLLQSRVVRIDEVR